MKKTSRLLAFVLLAAVACAWAADNFTVNVMVGSETEAPSLVFGEAEEESAVPFPPFSAMFGVKDVYLANPANLSGDEAAVTGDMARLGTDLRTASDDNAWVLVASTDASLKLHSNSEVTLYLQSDADASAEAEEITISDGHPYSLAAKAGVNYTLRKTRSAGDGAITPAVDPANQSIFLEQDEATKNYVSLKNGSASFSGTALTLQVVTGDKEVTLTDGTDYYLNDGTTSSTAPAAGWILKVAADGAAITYQDAAATLAFAEGSHDIVLSMTALSGGYRPVSTTLFDGSTKIAAFDWVILRAGTLDFDGNGVVNMNDAMYLYNYVSADCPTAEDDWFTIEELKPFVENATDADLQAALETLQAAGDTLDYDNDGDVDMNDAMYLYNYVSADCPAAEDDWFTTEELKPFVENATDGDLQTALETLQGLKE